LKTLKTLSSGQIYKKPKKKPKKTLKPKKPQKPKKTTGLVFFKKPGFFSKFSTLLQGGRSGRGRGGGEAQR
jgi:hypothetical protein